MLHDPDGEVPLDETLEPLNEQVEAGNLQRPSAAVTRSLMTQGASEGMWGFEDKLADHHWHADGGWIQEQVAPYRLKVMLYFDPQSRNTGALRIMSGSHRSPYHDALLPWNEVHSTLGAAQS